MGPIHIRTCLNTMVALALYSVESTILIVKRVHRIVLLKYLALAEPCQILGIGLEQVLPLIWDVQCQDRSGQDRVQIDKCGTSDTLASGTMALNLVRGD